MYASVRNPPEVPGGLAVDVPAPEEVRRRRLRTRVGGTVVAMGLVSFFTDASAEMEPAEKDAISHRGRAFRALAPLIATTLGASDKS